ncbi:hypothetical protein [Mucilaginibacter ginsenosidivorans]|uniref:Uncharacterized protein n=1 Tax=Mucilaginibacter ginsenosidivorans TaxID=398053 RepID=A0A5B8UU93_9SPHI|nr:hypothetical protein [Mucilaginibacter ginsenosidivorans]QEC62690.1 hypothetical protein FRZ54_08855 [Mucilaginibacter ginsenosidivorans]
MFYKRLINFMRVVTISANIIFLAWTIYNGIQGDFDSTLIQAFPYDGLMVLLAMNCILLIERKTRTVHIY